jgi:SAM-dependent methyltransferase
VSSNRLDQPIRSTRRSHLASCAVQFLGRAQEASALAVSGLAPANPFVLNIGRRNNRFVRQLKKSQPSARVVQLRRISRGYRVRRQIETSTRREAEVLPYADRTFDAVISLYSLQYWSHVPTAFSEMARVLGPNGVLVVSDVTAEDVVGNIEAASRLSRRIFEPGPAIADFYWWLEGAGLRPLEVGPTLSGRSGLMVIAEKDSGEIS